MYCCPREESAWLGTDVIRLLALTADFGGQVGCESTAHSGNLLSVNLEVLDGSLQDVYELLQRLSLTLQELNIK